PMPTLLVEQDDQQTLITIHGRTPIGRSAENRIVIADAHVLPLHACIVSEGRDSYIEDLSGGLSTEVNGELVSQRQPLRDGDRIRIGPARITFSEAGDEDPPREQASPTELIRFQCACGATIKARAVLAGRRGRCKRCGEMVTVPQPDEEVLEAVEILDDEPESIGVKEVCSVCQSDLDEEDERTICSACGLPFHSECWRENLGCSAYGCRNVNALKPRPQPLPARPPLRSFGPPVQTGPRPAAVDPGTPWEYLFLAGTALAVLLGLVTFGLTALVAGIAAGAYVVLRFDRARLVLMTICLVAAALGFLVGIVVSIMLWV
ncbi:MAG: FHA domain-containing protein, partial [Planctomycetaceae bacterium]